MILIIVERLRVDKWEGGGRVRGDIKEKVVMMSGSVIGLIDGYL